MTMNRRGAIAGAGSLAALGWFRPAAGADYPTHPVTIVVPYTPGGSVDLTARALGPELTKAWGQQILVDNRPGAGGSVGAAFVAKATPDGYTLLLSTNAPLTTNLALYPSIGYETMRDFEPIILTGESPSVIAVYPGVAAKTIGELVKYAKQHPGELSAGTSGNGSTADLTVAEFNRVAGIEIKAVPYRGGVPSLTAAMSGEVQVVFSDIVPAMEFIKSGKLRALAVTSAKRSLFGPAIPTLAESGYPGFDMASWVGLVAPKGTPREIILKINRQIVQLFRNPAFGRQLVQVIGVQPSGDTPAEFTAFLRKEIPRWQKIVKDANLKVE